MRTSLLEHKIPYGGNGLDSGVGIKRVRVRASDKIDFLEFSYRYNAGTPDSCGGTGGTEYIDDNDDYQYGSDACEVMFINGRADKTRLYAIQFVWYCAGCSELNGEHC